MPKEIKLRDLSDKDNEMLDTLRRMTGKGHSSQAVITACYRLLEREKYIDELEGKVRELQRKIYSYENNVRSMLMAQSNLAELLPSKTNSYEDFEE